METVLSVATRAVVDACVARGLDADELLDAAGLTLADVANPDARLPAGKADVLWGAAYERARDPHLALHAAEALPFGAYRVIDFVCANSPTAGAALERIARYFALVDPRATIDVREGDPSEVGMRARRGGVALPRAAEEYTFAALVTRMRSCAGDAWSPDLVEVSFPPPPDAREHRRLFGCEVRFGCAAARMTLGRAAWDAPITSASPALLAVLETYADRLVRELPAREDLAARVSAALAAELDGGEPTLARVARRLGTSERTLQRRMREEGCTLVGLLDEARSAAAKAHLADRGVALAEVAWLLGFADQSTFTRAFRRWTGMTPAAWRSSSRK